MHQFIIHKSASRGYANHGWLIARHTFSFARYHDSERMNFGVLRVMNDDIIGAGMGFGTHPHDNMEIITIPLSGDLAHKDSMGNEAIIRHGDIQVMSAGTGILHSEFNPNKDIEAKILQIWMFPNKQNVEPRYDQISLNLKDQKNELQQILFGLSGYRTTFEVVPELVLRLPIEFNSVNFLWNTNLIVPYFTRWHNIVYRIL
jgi:redox-sensitive bicupin YhaK (pirin superfamily)